jgi:hypothetical protein
MERIPLSEKIYLYEKVKFVKGANFVTVENTKELSVEEMLDLIYYLLQDSMFEKLTYLNILVHSKFPGNVEEYLQKNEFHLHDELVMVYKDLSEKIDVLSRFTFKSLNELERDIFKKIWQESMLSSLSAPTSNIQDQMRSVEIELGANYKDSCLIAYENKNPIGVIMPHIEPGTREEGRLFYFGITPVMRGKGKSKLLHQQALEILRNDFNAAYYIGCTSKNNEPMLKTFTNNGCEVMERNKVYKWIRK